MKLASGARKTIEAAALRAYPHECCGLLIGTPESITEAVETENLERAPDRFHIDPAVHLAVQRRLRGSGQTILGYFHSHPDGGAVPSALDLALAPPYPCLLVIADVDTARVRALQAWRHDIDEKRFSPCALSL